MAVAEAWIFHVQAPAGLVCLANRLTAGAENVSQSWRQWGDARLSDQVTWQAATTTTTSLHGLVGEKLRRGLPEKLHLAHIYKIWCRWEKFRSLMEGVWLDVLTLTDRLLIKINEVSVMDFCD